MLNLFFFLTFLPALIEFLFTYDEQLYDNKITNIQWLLNEGNIKA